MFSASDLRISTVSFLKAGFAVERQSGLRGHLRFLHRVDSFLSTDLRWSTPGGHLVQLFPREVRSNLGPLSEVLNLRSLLLLLVLIAFSETEATVWTPAS